MLGVVAALTMWMLMKYRECTNERNHRMMNQVLFRLRKSQIGMMTHEVQKINKRDKIYLFMGRYKKEQRS